MERQIVLLRGVNVGKGNRIAMADLRTLLTDLGHTDVATLLNSGNAVVTAPTAASRTASDVAAALAGRGLKVDVMVRSRDDLAAAIADDPFGDLVTNGSRYLVGFCDRPATPDPALWPDPAATTPDRYEIRGEHVYLWLPEGVMVATVPLEKLGRALGGVSVTTRNWNTVTKLLALADR